MKVEDKVALCAIKHHAESHIVLDAGICAGCTGKVCVIACPAQLYTTEEDGTGVKVDHSGCLECGTCLIVCPSKAVAWRYPEPGFGIRYRYG